MSYDSIDWDYHTVFSYIMDPVQRRHKGISEVIVATGTQELLQNNRDFGNIIKQVPFLDAHSASLYDIYGDRVNNINWLLMTEDHSVAVEETDRFLAAYSAPPINWNREYTHATGSYMSSVFDTVKSLWENNPTYDDTVRNYFSKDIDLYNQVKECYARDNSSQHS